MYSFFELWGSAGAFSYGQRFLTGFIPVLAIFIGIAVNEFFIAGPKTSGTRAVQAVIILLIVSSVLIQGIGVFLYPLLPDRSAGSLDPWNPDHNPVVESWWYGISHIDSITTYSFPPLPPLFHWEFKSPGGLSP